MFAQYMIIQTINYADEKLHKTMITIITYHANRE